MGDWTSLIYIFSQVFTIVAYGFIATTYFVKRRAIVLLVLIGSNLCMGIGFAFLSAWVAVGFCCIAMTRDVVNYIINLKRKEEDKTKITRLDCALLALWISAIVGVTIAVELGNGFMPWLSAFATLTFTVSIWQKNPLIYRILGIFVGVFWITYNAYIESLMGVVLESCLLAFVVLGIALYIFKERGKKQNAESKNIKEKAEQKNEKQ